MNIEHLTDDELDRVLCGEGLDRDRAVHLAGCVACRRRRDAFTAAVGEARGEDPGARELNAARAAALAAWEAPATHSRNWRWIAAAAVLLLALVLPTWLGQRPTTTAGFDADAVLSEVDAVLERDPLTVVASEAVVDVVAPLDESSWQGGA